MHTQALIFIQDMAIIMLVAGFTTVLCHRLRQPIVIGYIIAGIIVGPHTPPFSFISNETTINTLAELGVIFLMFSLGLEFNIHKLLRVGFVAFIAATLEIVVMIGLGYEIGSLFGWQKIDAIFLGAILAISSTTIIVKALSELGLKKENFAQLIFGILILEDIFAILILALLSSAAMTGSFDGTEIVFTTTKLSAFLVISLLLGILLVPRLLTYIAKFNSNEMLLISVLGLCFGFSLLVVKLDYSVALGAFIIGAIIAEASELTKIERLINPIRDMFSAIFFVSVGLLLNITLFIDYLVPILLITLVVIFGKVISCSLGVLIAGRDGKTAMRVGMGLAQIGEFSFIIASLGISLHVTGNFLFSIAVGVSIITTLLTPYLIKHSDTVAGFVAKFIPNSVASIFNLYATWMQNIKPEAEQSKLKAIIKQSTLQVIINLFVVVAIFLVAAYLAKTQLGSLLVKITNIHIQKTLIWAAALVISLPFIIASYRKIKALSMILAELNVKARVDTHLTVNVRRIIAEVIPFLSILGIMAFISLLSVSILPPFELLIVIAILAILLITFLLPWFIKLHARLQISMIEALERKKKRDK